VTKEQFHLYIRKKNKFDNVFNYFLCSCVLAIGIYFLIKIVSDFKPHQPIDKYLIWSLPLILISMGLYVMWRIPKNYIVHELHSSISLERKLKILDEYFSSFKFSKREINGNIISYWYTNKYLSTVHVFFYIDEDRLLFNIQTGEMLSPKGVLDYGISRRASKRLLNYLYKHINL